MQTALDEIWNAVRAGLATRAGTWIVLLMGPLAAFLAVAAIFVVHVILQGVTGGLRTVHLVFRFVELHLLAIMVGLLSAWCLLTAGLGLYDRPYGDWFEQGAIGVLAAALHLLGTAIWLMVGLMSLKFAVSLVIRAYRRSRAYT